MIRWSDALAQCQKSDTAHVLVTVIGTAGSVPRNSGTKMLVTADELFDTIGGGNLELHAVEQARELINEQITGQRLVKYPLAAVLGQCCGGHATLLFESFCQTSQTLWLFGAGHVGSALVKILNELPLNVHWVDTRAEQFPKDIDPAIQCHHPDDPTDVFTQINPNAILLIMTHSHDQDYRICEQALSQQHQGFIGLIGSKTKAARFRHRLRHAGLSQTAIDAIESPVGLSEIGGKRPMEVAVSIAARIIQCYQSNSESLAEKAALSSPDLAEISQQLTRKPDDLN
ncbi:MAG: xanthine dehydrogenase accessory protein XdhC [Oceanospirillales bacterium]|nr:MAG: xanthine dehydrogenase accessory protein XdhC [Oceanospirillales bacterium]